MELDLQLDKTGFPMVWMDSINAYVQWLPVTKIQMEYFLAETNDAIFDETWYYQLNQLNQRIAPTQVQSNNYWQVFATGILPRETQRYALWCGRGYSLITSDEWQQVYAEARDIEAESDVIKQVTGVKDIKERPRTLLQRVHRALPADNGVDGQRTLADLMLLRMGIMEFVFEDHNRSTFVGLGLTNPDFVGSFRRPEEPQTLKNPSEGSRMRNYGFRLVYRGA